MKQFIILAVSALIVPGTTFALVAPTTPPPTATTTSIVLPDPGLDPSDFFYFFDIFGEKFDQLLTFRQESKARLALAHSQERAAEVHALLRKKGADSAEVKRAKDSFDAELGRAASVIAATGKTDATKELYDGFESSKEMLAEVYHDYQKDLSKEREDVKSLMKDKKAHNDSSNMGDLEAELSRLESEDRAVSDDDDSIDKDFATSTASMEGVVGLEHALSVRIANIERDRARLMSKLAARKETVDPVMLADFTKTITEAKKALAAKEFSVVKVLLLDANDILHNLKNAAENGSDEESLMGDDEDDVNGLLKDNEDENENEGEDNDGEEDRMRSGYNHSNEAKTPGSKEDR